MSPYWYPLSLPTIGEEEVGAVTRVLRSGHTTMGDEVETFEAQFARGVGAAHAVMVNSGSSADLLLAFALTEDLTPGRRLLPGDEILVPAVTWPTHIWAWQMAGFQVRLVDVDPQTLNATAENYEAAITPHTRVLSLVHLMGNPCEMDRIWALAHANDLLITEDCCEALGASFMDKPVGSWGVGATYSFFFSHQMTTMEGGMVTTDRADLADRLRSLRSHGWTRHNPVLVDDLDPRYTFTNWGFNVRPTEVQAAIGSVQYRRLPWMNNSRARNYTTFTDQILGLGLRTPHVSQLAAPSWFGLPLMVSAHAPYTRDSLAAHLEAHGVETRPILGGNLARQPIADRLTFGKLPGADEIHNRGLFIGLHDGVERVVDLIHACEKVPA